MKGNQCTSKPRAPIRGIRIFGCLPELTKAAALETASVPDITAFPLLLRHYA